MHGVKLQFTIIMLNRAMSNRETILTITPIYIYIYIYQWFKLDLYIYIYQWFKLYKSSNITSPIFLVKILLILIYMLYTYYINVTAFIRVFFLATQWNMQGLRARAAPRIWRWGGGQCIARWGPVGGGSIQIKTLKFEVFQILKERWGYITPLPQLVWWRHPYLRGLP